MYAKLALSFATAALILAAAGFLLVDARLKKLQPTLADEPQGRPPGVVPAEPVVRSGDDAPAEPRAGAPSEPAAPKDVDAKLDDIIECLVEMADEDYDYYSDLSGDLYAIKSEVRKLKNTLKQIVQGLGTGPGGIPKIGWGILPKKAPVNGEVVKRYVEDAEAFGIEVKPGRVTVRGFLNMSPNTSMPIEYFITRFPEASHETLVHVIGNKNLEELSENPYLGLKGLGTALYKAMVAAGFEEGEPMHPDPDSPDRRNPRWILATGETVYVAVRYEFEGKTHVARATDWVLDPAAETVLAPDSFRFTGSARGEDPDTGEEVLRTELMGLVASVYPTSAALVEVALESALRNDFSYNFARIPKPTGNEPLYLDVIFSKTPIEPEGDGAKPLLRPPADDTGANGKGASEDE